MSSTHPTDGSTEPLQELWSQIRQASALMEALREENARLKANATALEALATRLEALADRLEELGELS